MTSLLDYAKQELELAGYKASDTEEGPNKWLRDGVLELLEAFSNQGHSGSSAPFMVQMFGRLAMYKPLGPLTGADDEWVEVGDGMYQNKRASSVFKNADGKAEWIDGIVFWEWATDTETGEKFKLYFINSDSRVEIQFPFVMPDSPEYRERIDGAKEPEE